MLAYSKEKYLKAIYKIALKEDEVSPVILSKELGISASSVIDMIKKLSTDNFIFYKKKKEFI